MPKALHDLAKKLERRPGVREPWALATHMVKARSMKKKRPKKKKRLKVKLY